MLETPSIRRYSFMSQVTNRLPGMSSENPNGAGNQQERPGFEQWIVGFVDGEGCFSISIVRNATCRLGWQAQHEFSVTQAASSKRALYALQAYFQCGRVVEQHRRDNHREALMRFSVKDRRDLLKEIIPFFDEHPLITAKAADFTKFAGIVGMMEEGRHLTSEGLRQIAILTETMNRKKRSRFLESSEAIRQPTHVDIMS